MEPFRADETVLLAVHYQNENCHPDGKVALGFVSDDRRRETLAAARTLLAAARRAGIGIVHVRMAQRADYRDVAPINAMFRQWLETGGWVDGSWGADFIESLAPQGDEFVVSHVRNNAFLGSPLETYLRALGARRLIIAGVSTTYAVESAVRHAADLDYAITVAADACAIGDQAMHEASLKTMAFIADIGTVAEIARVLEPATE